jgi:hypothetical protein
MPVPVPLQLQVILTALKYDRNLLDRASDELRIGVVVAPDDPASVRARAEFERAFAQLGGATFLRRPMRLRVIEFGSAAHMDGELRDARVHVLYIAPGNAANIESLVRLASEQRIVTTTGVPDYVKQGVAMGVGEQQDRPQILINMAAARSAGSEFDVSLLLIARRIGR